MSTPAGSEAKHHRSLGITIVSGLSLLLVLGLVFAVAYGSQRITTSAAALHDADETLRSATVTRAQLALAVHMAGVDQLVGSNSSAAIQLSVDEAQLALADVATGSDHLAEELGGTDDLVEAAQRFQASSGAILASLAEGDVAAARARSDTALDEDFQSLTGHLVGVRDELSLNVASSDKLLGQIGNLARFLVAFLVPAAVVLIYRELVKRQQKQAELETRLEAERQINLARERFIATASHELRTPLTSIMGLSMMLAEEEAVQGAPAAADLLRIIISESDDLARMVEDLLTVARLDARALHYTFEDIDAVEELEQIVDNLTLSGTEAVANIQPGLIRADQLRFRQVVRNLLSNARKYGGTRIRIKGKVEGRSYLCSVIDDGPGIPGDLVPRLFQRFIHQGEGTASHESVGLGLSIVHALAHGMGGSVTYERIEDETHFSLRLPLAEAATEPAGRVVTDVPFANPATVEAGAIAASTQYDLPEARD